MKIGQIISAPPFAWETGGCARVAFDISRALARKDHDVTIITTDLFRPGTRYPASKMHEQIDGVDILRFPCISDSLAWKYKMPLSPGLASYLGKHIGEYDIIHLQDLISYQAIATIRHCRRSGVPYVLTAHGSLPWMASDGLINRVYRSLWGSHILSGASKIIVLNRTERELCERLGVESERTMILPNGICLSDYSDLPGKGEFRNRYGIDEKNIVLYLGRLHPTKGLDGLLLSFSDLLKECPDAVLVMIGPDDGMRPMLQRIAGKEGIIDHVHFIGYVEHRDKLAALIDADVLVTPRFTGFPITFVEACVSGLPIITTTDGDTLDWIHDKVGLVTGHGRAELKRAMLSVLRDDELRARLGAEGKGMAMTRFNWDSITNEIVAAYDEAVAGRNHG
ncbi:MAG: glycosyltransferase [Euryarchaeota archaeon]|nr:glycosyltransferase [Euryarchaeota archaeon]